MMVIGLTYPANTKISAPVTVFWLTPELYLSVFACEKLRESEETSLSASPRTHACHINDVKYIELVLMESSNGK